MMKNNNLIITMCLDPYRYPTCCVIKLILTLISEQSNVSSLWKQRVCRNSTLDLPFLPFVIQYIMCFNRMK